VRMVVGVDGSDEGRRALAWACAEAQTHGATVHVVHVWQYPYGIAPAAALATREELRASLERDAEEVLANEWRLHARVARGAAGRPARRWLARPGRVSQGCCSDRSGSSARTTPAVRS
jgi:nucleotide-binding universal stress UspA family protein